MRCAFSLALEVAVLIATRQAGIPHVVCWKTVVPDDVARLFAQYFWNKLTTDYVDNLKNPRKHTFDYLVKHAVAEAKNSIELEKWTNFAEADSER